MGLYQKIRYKVITLLNREITPPSYDIKRAQIKKYKAQYNVNVFVETGTFLGDTVEFFKTIFNRVYSIELAEDLAQNAKKRFESDDNVNIIQGDSADVLKNLVGEINEPILFWLDGHYSSEFFVGDQYIKTGRGKKDTPIEEELKIILESPISHVILIDDARLFLGINDYPSIFQIKKLIRNCDLKYTVKVENDIINILP